VTKTSPNWWDAMIAQGWTMISPASDVFRRDVFDCPGCGEVQLPDEVGTQRCPECGATIETEPSSPVVEQPPDESDAGERAERARVEASRRETRRR